MANTSIFNAFERMWQHVVAVLSNKSDVGHTHNDMYEEKGAVGTHNVATDAHNDIRLLVDGLTTRLNALADSDDVTLDQMSEIVAYIKSYKDLIEQVTTNKVNVADIINNLTTNVANKPLSAAQGVALKALIDAIKVPAKTSELENDSGYLTAIPDGYATETYVDEAIGSIPAPDMSSKQDKLVGTQGQVVGFDEDGNAVAQEAPESNVQHDWNVNDENDPAYIKNRPFYETDPVETVILEEMTVVVEEGYAELPSWQQYTPGTTYIICFNGNEYECVAWGGEYAVCVGNGDIYGDEGMGGDEPFSIDTYPDGSAYINVAEPGTYTVSIVGMISEVIEIPQKYMPIKNIRDGEGQFSIAEGGYTTASGYISHAEGEYTMASGYASHTEGMGNVSIVTIIPLTGAAGSSVYSYPPTEFDFSLVGTCVDYNEQFYNIIEHNVEEGTIILNHTLSENSDISNEEVMILLGVSIASGEASHVEGISTMASGDFSHAEGGYTTASGYISHAEGEGTMASAYSSHAEGFDTTASGYFSHAEGNYTKAFGESSHAEGDGAIAFGNYSHAEGRGGIYYIGYIFLTGEANSTRYSYTTDFDDVLVGLHIDHNGAIFNIVEHNVEENTIVLNRTLSEDSDISNEEMPIAYVNGMASGEASHTEGKGTIASGYISHAEGAETMASGDCSHAEGEWTIASGDCSHAEGKATETYGYASHAEGEGTTASGYASHAEGEWTIASSDYQHVQGVNNIPDEETKYAHIVGNGDFEGFQSNAHTLDWNGNAWFAGDVYVGSTSGTNRDEGSKKLVTVDEMNAAIQAAIEAAFANIARAEESEF